MKHKIFSILLSVMAIAGCTKSNEEQGGNNGALGAPDVQIIAEATSLTAMWNPVNGADGYRIEITYLADGINADVVKENIKETNYIAKGLHPGRTYTVRIAATKDGKASSNWFYKDVTTDSKAITFEITPYECYDKKGGYLYYSAFVKPSDDGIYYWVGAVAYSSKGDAKSWIETDIQNHIDKGETWESLVKDKYIIQGKSQCGFEFDGADDMMFTAAAVEKTKKGIEIISDVSMSYPFYAINHGASKSHPATFDDFVGEWVCMPNGQYSRKEDNTLEVVESKPFNVTIAKSGSNTLTITGWGGDRNRFSSSPITIDYKNATDEIDEHFTITLPQTIKTEGETEWAYTSWFVLSSMKDGVTTSLYQPYDKEYAVTVMPSWKVGFHGYIGNKNKTVIKIEGERYTGSDLGAEMTGLWPCGMNAEGKFSKFLNGSEKRNDDPISMYYLARKDFAEGKVFQAPDVSNEIISSASVKSAGAKALTYKRVNQ
jgi:hypothetical protein